MKKLFNNEFFLPGLVVVIAVIFRFSNLAARFHFSGEIGDNLLDIKDFIIAKEIPLIGPPTSHPWLYFGPFYYWLMIPLMLAFKFNPLVSAYVGAVLGIAIVVMNYFVILKIFGKRIAVISSILIALSPLFILFSQTSRFYFFTVLFFYGLFYSLNSFWRGDKKMLFWTGLAYGMMLNLHYSSLLLLPVVLLALYLKRRGLRFRNYLNIFLGLILTFIPILIYDFQSNFSMVKQFVLWIPYRFLGFIGIIPKNTVSFNSISQSLNSFMEFFGGSFTEVKMFWPIATIIILGICGYWLKTKKIKVREFPWLFLISSLAFCLIGIIVHGEAPLHYLLPIFPIPIILISKILSDLIKTERVYIYLLIFLLLANLNFYKKLFFDKKEVASVTPSFVPFQIQKDIASIIIKQAHGRKFSLTRVGPNDDFPEFYAQNYQYLLWYLGNKPTAGVQLKYTIYEDISKLPQNNLEVIWVDGIAIVKS